HTRPPAHQSEIPGAWPADRRPPVASAPETYPRLHNARSSIVLTGCVDLPRPLLERRDPSDDLFHELKLARKPLPPGPSPEVTVSDQSSVIRRLSVIQARLP